MARARKCDRCGSLYEPETLKMCGEKINGILLIDRDMDNKYIARTAYDLCPDCLHDFAKFLHARKED